MKIDENCNKILLVNVYNLKSDNLGFSSKCSRGVKVERTMTCLWE